MSKKETKKRKQEPPFFDIQQVASCTECTGILPAQIETDEEGQAVSQLQSTYPVRPPEGGK